MISRCLNGVVGLISRGVKGAITLCESRLSLRIQRLEEVVANIALLGKPITTTVADVGSHLKMSCGIVCNIGSSNYILHFEKATLVWGGNDNRAGAIKYNTL